MSDAFDAAQAAVQNAAVAAGPHPALDQALAAVRAAVEEAQHLRWEYETCLEHLHAATAVDSAAVGDAVALLGTLPLTREQSLALSTLQAAAALGEVRTPVSAAAVPPGPWRWVREETKPAVWALVGADAAPVLRSDDLAAAPGRCDGIPAGPVARLIARAWELASLDERGPVTDPLF